MTGYIIGALLTLGILAAIFGERLITLIVYGKPVFRDVSGEALRAAEERLKAAGIKYTVTTLRSRAGYLQGQDVAAHMRANIPYRQSTAQVAFIYLIYVKRKYRDEAARVLAV